MMQIKKNLKLIIASVLALSMLAGCGDKSGTGDTGTKAPDTSAADTKDTAAVDTTTPADTDAPKDDVVSRDLGGKLITIGNWWSNSDDFVAKSSYQEALVEYRNDIQEKYNCTIKEVNLCGWGEMMELCATSIMASTPEASIFVLDSSFVASLLKQGLFYDVASLPSANFDDEKWNQLVRDVMTFNGKTYGFATGYEPRYGVFFNKRLFEEAGIDPNLPYDLQKEGTWTWDEFTKLCDKLTYDKDNDGIKDAYALTTFTNTLFTAILYSNNAKAVGKDDNGMFYNATSEPQFLEACQFMYQLNENGYNLPQPEGSNWDYFKAAFHDGQAAMRIDEEYVKGDLEDMADDFGFVLFPAGTSGAMTPVYRENVLVIPSCFSEQEADDILFAYDMWTNDVPGYDDEDDWKIASYPAYRDERAVDETLSIMREGKNGSLNVTAYVSGLEIGNICWNIWGGEQTPAELIESVQNAWNERIDAANAVFQQ